MSTLSDQTESADILLALGRACWAQAHDGGACPPERMPTQAGLAAWLPRLPSSSAAEAIERLGAVQQQPSVCWSWVAVGDELFVAEDGQPSVNLDQVHATWRSHPEPRPKHPLAPVVAAWQRLAPVSVRMPADKDSLILSRSVACVGADAESYYRARFPSAAHRAPDGQLSMGFAEEGEAGPTLPANVWTMGLAEAEKRGAVVPLALRIWVACILHTPLRARHGNYPAMLKMHDGGDLTLRHFLEWTYPGRGRRPKPVEYWPRLLRAREVINATELPFEYPPGSGTLWARPVVTLAGPLTRPGLDDPWPVYVHMPPGEGTGPRINWDRLLYWSTRDAACYRSLINLSYRWHIEGKRLMPAPGGNHWLQRREPSLYDRITDAEADVLCFPPGTGRRRRIQRIADARAALEKLVREGDAEAIDGRLLPPPAGREGEVGTRA